MVRSVLGEADDARALVIVFSDGTDTGSFLTPAAVLSTAARTAAVVYGVSASDAPTAFLDDLCHVTGGRVLSVQFASAARRRYRRPGSQNLRRCRWAEAQKTADWSWCVAGVSNEIAGTDPAQSSAGATHDDDRGAGEFPRGRAAEEAVLRQHILRTLESMDGKIDAQFHWLVGLFVTTALGFAAILVTIVRH